jgi:hypothetical protein
MRSTSVAEFKARLSEHLERLDDGPLVVLRHGRPRAVVLRPPADPEDLDSLLIGFDPRFWAMLERSDRAKEISEREFWRRAEKRHRSRKEKPKRRA